MFRSIVCLSLGLALGGSFLNASNYPADYGKQSVFTWNAGPAFVATVKSAFMGGDYILGYKKSGPLAKSQPAYIDAVVTITCDYHYGTGTTKLTGHKTFRLGKEWHGNGYLSSEISKYDMMGPCTRTGSGAHKMKVAFVDVKNPQNPNDDVWDNNRQYDDYSIPMIWQFKDWGAKVTPSDNPTSGMVTIKSWGIIVGELGK